MKIKFEYNKNRDIWCLLNKGKSSNNSSKPTKVYEELVAAKGNEPREFEVGDFVNEYVKLKGIEINEKLHNFENSFLEISDDFEQKAEKVFGVSLDKEITAYLTVNNRCPYNIEEKWFFVSMDWEYSNTIVMHELWHFYTWERFGEVELQKIGKEKYNDLKEALTVLLNVECGFLFPEGKEDKGYPQHQELRTKILEWWSEDRDIESVWNKSLEFLSKCSSD